MTTNYSDLHTLKYVKRKMDMNYKINQIIESYHTICFFQFKKKKFDMVLGRIELEKKRKIENF